MPEFFPRKQQVAGGLSSTLLWAGVLLATSLGLSIGRYMDLIWGNEVLNPDATRMFRPIAVGVVEGGTLYGPGLADNKPPGWQLLNVAAHWTGEYVFVMLLCVGVVNGLAAFLLYRWLSRTVDSSVPALASVLLVLSLPLVGGHHINSRPFALLFLLAAFAATTPARRGVAVAFAALFNAYAALFVPVFLWLTWRDASDSEWLPAARNYLASGAITGGAVFGFVGLIWGTGALLAALGWSYGLPVPDGVATSAVHPAADLPGSYLSQAWVLSHPIRWLMYVVPVVFQLAVVLVAAVVGLMHRRSLGSLELSQTATVGLGVALTPLFFRTYEQYWILPLPFLAAFGALGIVVFSEHYLP